MECRYIRSKFTGYADGDLQPADRRFVDRHVEKCSDCRQELQALTRFLDDCHEFLTACLQVLPEDRPSAFLQKLLCLQGACTCAHVHM